MILFRFPRPRWARAVSFTLAEVGFAVMLFSPLFLAGWLLWVVM